MDGDQVFCRVLAGPMLAAPLVQFWSCSNKRMWPNLSMFACEQLPSRHHLPQAAVVPHGGSQVILRGLCQAK